MALSRGEIISLLGLVLGLPGFFYYFFSPYCAAGILCLVIIGSLIYFFMYVPELPCFNIIEAKTSVIVKGVDGKKAHVKKDVKARANHSGITEYPFRGIAATGKITNFSSTHPIEVKCEAGGAVVIAKFNAPKKRGETGRITLEYDVLNTFDESENYFIHEVGFPTKKYCLEIHLPQSRTCKSASAYRYRGAHIDELPKPELSGSNTVIRFIVNRPGVGEEYRVVWTW